MTIGAANSSSAARLVAWKLLARISAIVNANPTSSAVRSTFGTTSTASDAQTRPHRNPMPAWIHSQRRSRSASTRPTCDPGADRLRSTLRARRHVSQIATRAIETTTMPIIQVVSSPLVERPISG